MAKRKEMKGSEFSCQSPVQPDYNRVVQYDEEGNEIVTYEEVDYPKVQASLGSWTDWSLNTLLKAGINPDFGIHTGNPTRLEGVDMIADLSAQADAILAGIEDEVNNL